jgi:hypothetical protein
MRVARAHAGTLVETYLDRDAGRRVLNGLIRRGVERPQELFALDPFWTG